MQEAPRATEDPGLNQTDAAQRSLLRARAVILGERLDHRGLGPGGNAMADPVPIAAPAPISAFAFRWGAVVIFGADPTEEATLLAALGPRITNSADSQAEEVALIALGAERDGVDAEGVIQLCDQAPERLAVVALVGIEVVFTLYEHLIRPLWH